MFVFGSGVLIGTQLNVANPTPINFGLVQKVSVDTSVSVKELYGQYAFPVAVGSGTRKVHVQGVPGALQRPSPRSPVLQSGRRLPGSTISQFAEVHSVPAASPLHGHRHATRRTSSPTRASSTRRPACRCIAVATSPAAGQYTFNAATGVYTFDSGRRGRRRSDLLHLHVIRRRRRRALAIANPLIGPTSTFSATAVRDRPDDERAVLGDAQPVRRQQVLVRHQYRGLRQAGLRVPGVRQRRRSGHDLQLRRRGVSEDGVRHIARRKDLVGPAPAVPRDQGDPAGAVRHLSRSRRPLDVGRIRRASQRGPARSPCRSDLAGGLFRRA